MKTKIVIGCVVAAFVLLMTPSISAVQYKTAVQSIKDVVSDIQSKASTNERMQLLQSFIKTLHNKSGIFSNFLLLLGIILSIPLLFVFISFIIIWIALYAA